MAEAVYYSWQERAGAWLLKLCAWAVLIFLILPILIVIPLSFHSEPFFTFTEGMLQLDPQAYSLEWYRAIFRSSDWLISIRNSFFIGVCATIIATILGTLAAVGLASEH